VSLQETTHGVLRQRERPMLRERLARLDERRPGARDDGDTLIGHGSSG
jgi:hypothetical protein